MVDLPDVMYIIFIQVYVYAMHRNCFLIGPVVSAVLKAPNHTQKNRTKWTPFEQNFIGD